MTLNSTWFLNATGQFLPIIGTSTSTSTSVFTALTAATTVDISLSTTGPFDGPFVSQGSSGTWFASGQVTMLAGAGGNTTLTAKLWDGTTVIAEAANSCPLSNIASVSLSGILASPAGNLKITATTNRATATLTFNHFGDSKDSVITAIRIG